jgi:hypothetical protein
LHKCSLNAPIFKEKDHSVEVVVDPVVDIAADFEAAQEDSRIEVHTSCFQDSCILDNDVYGILLDKLSKVCKEEST